MAANEVTPDGYNVHNVNKAPISPSEGVDPNGKHLYIGKRSQSWWVNRKLHRVDGAALVIRKGHVDNGFDEEFWYLNDKLHRVDGPAVVTRHHESWYQDGLLHRVNGPAVSVHSTKGTKGIMLSANLMGGFSLSPEGDDGIPFEYTEIWAQNGKYHRTVGPALWGVLEGGAYVGRGRYDAYFINGRATRGNDEPAIVTPRVSIWMIDGTIVRAQPGAPGVVRHAYHIFAHLDENAIPVETPAEEEYWVDGMEVENAEDVIDFGGFNIKG